MKKYQRGNNRNELLADIAEMYYEGEMTQSVISRIVGVTRSAVSRMLTEARKKGIVEIRINRPLRFDHALEKALIERFGLMQALVLTWDHDNQYDELRSRLGMAAAGMLEDLLVPGTVVGVAWGTTVNETINALQLSDTVDITVIQLVGVLGASDHVYSAQSLVEDLASATGGQAIYLYTPFLVDSPQTAESLRNTASVREIIAMGKQCSLAILGVGATHPDFCSLYQGGHISELVLQDLLQVGAVGDVSGHYFDLNGDSLDTEIQERVIGIPREDLLGIPVRLGVAGGAAKASAVRGALRGGYINMLVTDSQTAACVLDQS